MKNPTDELIFAIGVAVGLFLFLGIIAYGGRPAWIALAVVCSLVSGVIAYVVCHFIRKWW